jgi:hypothetical protein
MLWSLTSALSCLQLEEACKVECLQEWHKYKVRYPALVQLLQAPVECTRA